MQIHYKFSKTDIDKLLKENFMVLYDTREHENKNQHILDYFDKKKIKYKKKKIDEGDYTAIITKRPEMGIYRDLYFPVAVERKNSVDELANNLSDKTDTHDDIRLVRELRRAKQKGIKMFLVIEDERGLKNIKTGNYRSLYKPVSFIARLKSLQDQFLNGTSFVNKADSGEEIFLTLKYGVRNFLKELDADISPKEEML
ncbi:molybdopterin-guanine dinucleotide biosynthesis protein A [Clostridium sp. AWRP]|nr:molybdopterin-guanine dinucleotide biosynthesis protein A [Clostridium sp. AWRP]